MAQERGGAQTTSRQCPTRPGTLACAQSATRTRVRGVGVGGVQHVSVGVEHRKQRLLLGAGKVPGGRAASTLCALALLLLLLRALRCLGGSRCRRLLLLPLGCCGRMRAAAALLSPPRLQPLLNAKRGQLGGGLHSKVLYTLKPRLCIPRAGGEE